MTITTARICACGNEITRANPRFRFPTKCADCRTNGAARNGATPDVTEEPTTDAPPFDVVATIAALGLDYCVGSALRFLAEIRDDGDEVQNLRIAREYIDHALVARGAEL